MAHQNSDRIGAIVEEFNTFSPNVHLEFDPAKHLNVRSTWLGECLNSIFDAAFPGQPQNSRRGFSESERQMVRLHKHPRLRHLIHTHAIVETIAIVRILEDDVRSLLKASAW
ncbi:hypothetical protein ACM66B_006082 [Microbotryomycetes sp. NB124-2]